MALYGFRERIIIYFRWLTVLPNWGIRYWMWQLGQRPIHRQIFRVDILLIAPNLLFGQGKETSLFQLRFDEADKWRQADDRCVAFACHCPVGKIVWQAPHSKAISIVKSHNNGIYRARRMGARSFCGSSTTGIAANLLGRRYLGIEQEQEFAAMSRNRREELNNIEIVAKYRTKIKDMDHFNSLLPLMASEDSVSIYSDLPF